MEMGKPNKQNKSIATGLLYIHAEFECSYLKMWRFRTPQDIVPHKVGAVLDLRHRNIYSHREMVWYEVLQIGSL